MDTRLSILCLAVKTLIIVLLIPGHLGDVSDMTTAYSVRHQQMVGRVSRERNGKCGDGFCNCSHTASCDVKLTTYVPKLPARINHLKLSLHGFSGIGNADFFLNVTNISRLDLSDNKLAFICPKVFVPLKQLKSLRLNGNRLNTSALDPVFDIQTLETLHIARNGLLSLPKDLFEKHPMPHLQDLDLTGNKIRHIDLAVFSSLPRLHTLTLNLNFFSDDFFPDKLVSLETLHIERNAMFHFPSTCRNGTSLFPTLTYLSVHGNYITNLSDEICLPNLQILKLSDNAFRTITTDMFHQSLFPVLYYINLSHNRFLVSTQRMAFRNPNLTILVLQWNIYMCFSCEKQIHRETFRGVEALEKLRLRGTRMSVTEDRFLALFGNLVNLTTLSLASARMNKISPGMFHNFKRLKDLDLGKNRLASLPDGVFDTLPSLESVDLNDNQIQAVRETTFSASTLNRLTTLDIGGNPFRCDCELLWFQQRLLANCSLFQLCKFWPKEYFCDNIPHTTVQSFFVNPQSCLLDHETSVFIIATIIMLVSGFMTVSLLYRYRWHIRLVLYEAFRGQGDRWRRLHEQHFQYDVFVSYDSEDELWVQQHLMPELEERLGLRLCLHERDFIPGKNIVDNIVHCVQNSKKVMMLFSTNFSQSPWCQFELNLCLSHVMENDDMLLVVLLEDIPSRDITPAMMAVMKTTTYIEWDDHPEARASFWGRLQLGLQEIMPAV